MAPIRTLLTLAALALLSLPASASECRGLKSAHCHCRLLFGQHSGNPANMITPPGYEGKELMTYTIPNQCFNQQIDAGVYRINKGCWLACRNAYGVDGATPDPGMKAALQVAGKKLREVGYCGGWMNAESQFSAGTNKFRANTNVGIGVGIGGTVAQADALKTTQSPWKVAIDGAAAVVSGKKICK